MNSVACILNTLTEEVLVVFQINVAELSRDTLGWYCA